MAFTLVLSNILKDYAGGRDRLELASGVTVEDTLRTLGIPSALVAAVLRGNELVPKSYRPRDGETIKLLAIMGGG